MKGQSLIIISGVTAALGKAYLNYFKKRNFNVLGIVRSNPNVGQIVTDLLDKTKLEFSLGKINLRGIKEIIYIHSIGKFKFEKSGKPEIDKNKDGIDDEVFESNVTTFINFAALLLKKIKNKNISLVVCAFGSISDKYKVPFWQSYTRSKNELRNYIKYLIHKTELKNRSRGVFINLSTTNTGNENELRPFANKTYWLSPEQVVERSAPLILESNLLFQEIDLYNPIPNFDSTYYSDLKKLSDKWSREMGI